MKKQMADPQKHPVGGFWTLLSVEARRAVKWWLVSMAVSIPCMSMGAHLMSEPSTPLVWLGVIVYAVLVVVWLQTAWATWLAVLPLLVPEGSTDA